MAFQGISKAKLIKQVESSLAKGVQVSVIRAALRSDRYGLSETTIDKVIAVATAKEIDSRYGQDARLHDGKAAIGFKRWMTLGALAK